MMTLVGFCFFEVDVSGCEQPLSSEVGFFFVVMFMKGEAQLRIED